MNTMTNWTSALPEMALLTSICVILLAGLFIGHKFKNLHCNLTLISLAVLFGLTWNAMPSEQVLVFSGLFVADSISQWLKLALFVITAVALIYSQGYLTRHKLNVLEYYLLVLFALLGMMVMVSAAHMLSLYIGLELLSLSLYALVAIQRDSSRSSEAAMKYFVMGAIASGVLLYGLSIVYGISGTLNVYEIAEFVTKQMTAGQDESLLWMMGFALVFIIPAMAFKLGAAPFHMWLPDVYHGAPTSVTLLVSTAPKIAAFGMIMRVLVEAVPGMVEVWQPFLIGLAILSMGLGNIIAISQSNIKRMFAYSAIAHMGFFLLGMISGNQEGFAASMFYMIVYAAMSLGSFGLLVLLKKEEHDIESIEDLSGLSQSHPWYAFLMMLLLFSMAGVPPTVGFYAKLSVLKSIVGIDLVWVAGMAVFFSIIGAYYYLRVVKVMYFDQPQNTFQVSNTASRVSSALFSVNGLAIILMGIFPAVLMDLCLKLFNAL